MISLKQDWLSNAPKDLMAGTILTGSLQLVAGYLKLGNSLRFVSKRS